MMGGSHATSGAAAWLALAGTAEVAGYATGAGVLGEISPGGVIAGTLVTAGAAILPDIDHPSGTAARTAGPFSRTAARLVGSAVGHRGATHTLLAVVVFTLLAGVVAAADWRHTLPVVGEVQVGSVLAVTVMTVFAVSALKLVKGKIAPWLTGAAVALTVAVAAPDTAVWLPVAVGLGALVHILGDALTVQGVPFPTWPLTVKPKVATPLWHSNGFVALPVLGNAGSAREWVVCSLLSVYVAAAFGATVVAAF